MDGPINWWWTMNLLDVCVQAGFCQIRSHIRMHSVVSSLLNISQQACSHEAIYFCYTLVIYIATFLKQSFKIFKT